MLWWSICPKRFPLRFPVWTKGCRLWFRRFSIAWSRWRTGSQSRSSKKAVRKKRKISFEFFWRPQNMRKTNNYLLELLSGWFQLLVDGQKVEFDRFGWLVDRLWSFDQHQVHDWTHLNLMLLADLLANCHLELYTRASDLFGWNLNTNGFCKAKKRERVRSLGGIFLGDHWNSPEDSGAETCWSTVSEPISLIFTSNFSDGRVCSFNHTKQILSCSLVKTFGTVIK